MIRDEKLVENAATRGAELMAGLRSLQSKYPIRDVRGLGLMVGVEMKQDVKPGTATALSQACLEYGMLLLTTSVYETVRFIPPLTVSKQEIETGLSIFEKACAKVFGK